MIAGVNTGFSSNFGSQAGTAQPKEVNILSFQRDRNRGQYVLKLWLFSL